MADHTYLPPTALTIFGITGDLSRRKLIPALYHLLKNNRLPAKFSVIGVFRREPDIEAIIQEAEIQILRDHHDCDQAILDKLKNMITPIFMDSTKPEDYFKLRKLLDKTDDDQDVKMNRLFYLAIPPQIFLDVIGCLDHAGLNTPSDHTSTASRILVEKPFGNDLKSAEELIEQMSKTFTEKQIYRIDHYMAKETAQNILTFRFNNPLIEGLWSRQFIDHIQITASETIGIEGRVAFYEGMGALRDIMQSHLLQLMALVMMERPNNFTSHDIHQEKLLFLESIMPITEKHVDEVVVSGQYDTYRDEVKNQDSNVETYIALKLEAANQRWGGVPILLRTGKTLGNKLTEIAVVFKDRSRRNIAANLLRIHIQPDEGISIKLLAKKPGFSDVLQPVNMHFDYDDAFTGDHPDAYQRVIIDAIRGDQSLFATNNEVLACWRLLQPILDYWHGNHLTPEFYKSGSWGPEQADELAASYGCEWHKPDKSREQEEQPDKM